MGKLLYDERDGYSYISDNGISYILLKGKSYGGNTTSGIIFIMLDYDEDIFELCDGNEYVGYFWKDAFPTNEEEMIAIRNIVKNYENQHSDYIKCFKKKNESKKDKRHFRTVTFRQTIQKTIRVYDDDKKEGEDPRVAINNKITSLCEDDPELLDIESNFDSCTIDTVFIGEMEEED